LNFPLLCCCCKWLYWSPLTMRSVFWLHLKTFIEVMHCLNVVLYSFWYLLGAGVRHLLVWENILISSVHILIFNVLTLHLAERKCLVLFIVQTVLLWVSFWRLKLMISIFIFNGDLFFLIIIIYWFQLIKRVLYLFVLLVGFNWK
jgi:hypothetical protein